MQPLTCRAGYPMPIKKGRVEIWGVVATVNDPTAVSRLTLVDCEDFHILTNEVITPVNNRRHILDLKGLANADGTLSMFFPEPIKTMRGLSVINTTNLEGGKIFVYIR